MTQSHFLSGHAQRVRPVPSVSTFTPAELAEPAEKSRDRIWELANTLHCSIVGTCLTTAEGRGLLVKLGIPNARTMSEHHLHGQIVQLAGRRDGGGKLLQKALDRRHDLEIRQFDKARTTDAVRALWKEYLARGEIPGAYWAAITHPATDWALVQEIFGRGAYAVAPRRSSRTGPTFGASANSRWIWRRVTRLLRHKSFASAR